MNEIEEGQEVRQDNTGKVFHTKYQFPLCTVPRVEFQHFLASIGRPTKLPEHIPYFVVRVPPQFDPILISKDDTESAKKWQEAGCVVELV